MTKYLLILFSILFILSCSDGIIDNPVVNQKPETHLFLFADGEISQQKSKLQVHWWGDDKDGLVIGYLIKWEGIDVEWDFTTSNDSIFSLPIGTVDTSFTFLVASVDNSGNGIYDSDIQLSTNELIDEPFDDLNGNGSYDKGEPFIDFGAIDETPASQKFPIKNSQPEVTWNDLTVLPEESFPVMTIGWNAFDLDGDETITEIHLALNDTSQYIVLNGSTRLVSLTVNDLESITPEMDVYLNADPNKLLSEKLSNLKLDGNNRLFIRGIDNSGASSDFVGIPDTGRSWHIKKPKGDLLIVDDYSNGVSVSDFYQEKFNEFALNEFDVLDIEKTVLPYESITFKNTLNLFKYIYWYSDSSPRIELNNLITQNFIQSGGKIAYSMTFQDSSSTFEFSLPVLQSFLPIEDFGNDKPLSFMFSGANIIPSNQLVGYPTLETSSTIGFIRTLVISEITASKVYDLTSSQINGDIAFINNTKNLFFIGLPLHQCDAKNNVSQLLRQIFVNDFGMQ